MTDRMLLICDHPADDVWLIIQREIITLPPVWARSGARPFAARECKLMHACVRAHGGECIRDAYA